MAMIEPIDATAQGDSGYLLDTSISPTLQHHYGMGTVLAALAEHRSGGIVTVPAWEDHDASPDNNVVPPPPVADPVMAGLCLSTPISSGGGVGSIGGGAGRARIALGMDPQASEEITPFQACLCIAVIFTSREAETAVELMATKCGI